MNNVPIRQDPALGNKCRGAIVIAAHNEEQVIGRCLRALAPGSAEGLIDILVIPNGCTDGTAAVARSFPGVRVHEIVTASKVLALNVADQQVSLWPRLYVDADICISLDSALAVLERLETTALAARPPYVYRTTRATFLVRRYYAARARMETLSQHLWGAGVYGLSQLGHQRLSTFPDFLADDLYVDSLFYPEEINIVAAEPVAVQTPATVKALINTLRRVYKGKSQIMHSDANINSAPDSASTTALTLLKTVKGPRSAVDAAVYLSLALFARLPERDPTSWNRDDTSRRAENSDNPHSTQHLREPVGHDE